MQISDLSRRTGVSVPTIKFYLREGLIGPGVKTASTRSEYTDAHVERLRLIRTLTEVGDLPLRRVRAVVDALGDPGSLIWHALTPAIDPSSGDEVRALDEIDGFVDDELRWDVRADAPARRLLARALVALRQSGWEADPQVFRPHARAVDWLLSEEKPEAHGRIASDPGRAAMRLVAFESALMALRRLLLEHRAAR
jgi:DNA-binding transcriptional MerR regulator